MGVPHLPEYPPPPHGRHRRRRPRPVFCPVRLHHGAPGRHSARATGDQPRTPPRRLRGRARRSPRHAGALCLPCFLSVYLCCTSSRCDVRVLVMRAHVPFLALCVAGCLLGKHIHSPGSITLAVCKELHKRKCGRRARPRMTSCACSPPAAPTCTWRPRQQQRLQQQGPRRRAGGRSA